MTSTAAASPETAGFRFAGVMLVVLGFFNLIDGYALLEKAAWFDDRFIASNADTWGWILIVFAAFQLLAGVRLLTSAGGATLAIVLASFGMVIWFALLFTFPIMALIGTGINFSIIASVLSSKTA